MLVFVKADEGLENYPSQQSAAMSGSFFTAQLLHQHLLATFILLESYLFWKSFTKMCNFGTMWQFSHHRLSCLDLQSQPTHFTSLTVVWLGLASICFGSSSIGIGQNYLSGNWISLQPCRINYGTRFRFKVQHCLLFHLNWLISRKFQMYIYTKNWACVLLLFLDNCTVSCQSLS